MSENTNKKISTNLQENMDYLKEALQLDVSFDLVYRVVHVGGRKACIYFIDGFCKDVLMQKMLQYFMDMKEADLPENAHEMLKKKAPYVEVDMADNYDKLITNLLSGVFVLLIEGYDRAILIDSRTYPARSVDEPAKDKTLRGSKDGFVETIVFNTALIRRRIRDPHLRMEMMNAGKASRTDIVVCYMEDRVDKNFLKEIKTKIKNIKVDALTMNQQSLAECLFPYKWYNPFPKFKYTERPDTAAAQILEGNIVILVDNAPSVLIMPTSFFDVVEEADDYYFPPITGTYLRISRFIITVLTYVIAPLFLLLMQNPDWIPPDFQFIAIQGNVNVPIIWQFLILELAIDGLRLAAVNTPSMLSTPLSILAGLVLGEFSVKSGWFNSEVMLYMAFIAIASYTQPNYEMGYALKFMRIINLILTAIFNVWGFVAGIIILLVALGGNKTVSKQGYLYPLIPFDWKKLKNLVVRVRLPGSRE
ncbi:MAG: spore germination protein [Lachnospiraceae bacterium]|nr:spore germination protein [Lachnospiraceae bacterium]